MRILRASFLLLSFPVASSLFSEEPPARVEPRTVRVRALGLFSPDREQALREAVASLEEASLKDVDYETAHATFEIRPDKPWKDVHAEKLPERIDQALKQASRSIFGAAAASETPSERLEEIEIAAGGCVCRACELAAYEAVAKVEGVERATVSFGESRIAVRFDREKTNRAALEEALQQRGVKLLSETP
ncbi:MAG TPA: heavy metal-associated domain-containing protein [Pirellulaceae bacterium]|nr:heavy metal-associated domain-containing protein [Pirellulaceae bacterium]